MPKNYPLKEDTTRGTYTVSVRWSGGHTYEVEADSESQAAALAAEKAEEGFDMSDSDVTSTEIEFFEPDDDGPSAGALSAAEWADQIVDDLRRAGLPRTPIAGEGVDALVGGMPKAVVKALGLRSDTRTETEDDGTTYLYLVEAQPDS